MHQLLRALCVVGLLALAGGSVWGQTDTAEANVDFDLQEIALIAVTGPAVSLTIGPPAQAGEPPALDTDNDTYLQYTSTVALLNNRTIDAELDTALPDGTRLVASVTSISGVGQLGDVVLLVELDTTAQSLLTNIGGCATGMGAGEGARVLYIFQVSDIGSLRATASSHDVTVTYTLTD